MISWLKNLTGRHPVSEADLSAHVDGRLAERRRLEVERHLAVCVRCRSTVAEMRSVKDILASLPLAQASRPFTLSPQMATRPAAVPRRPGPVWAPALALSVLVLLLAVDATNTDFAGGRDSGNSLATKSVSRAEDSFSGAAAPAPRATGADTAQTPAGALQPQAGGAAMAGQATASSAESPLSPAQPTVAPPASQPEATAAERHGSDWSLLRVLEVLSALALILSVVYVWWYRSRSAGHE